MRTVPLSYPHSTTAFENSRPVYTIQHLYFVYGCANKRDYRDVVIVFRRFVVALRANDPVRRGVTQHKKREPGWVATRCVAHEMSPHRERRGNAAARGPYQPLPSSQCGHFISRPIDYRRPIVIKSPVDILCTGQSRPSQKVIQSQFANSCRLATGTCELILQHSYSFPFISEILTKDSERV